MKTLTVAALLCAVAALTAAAALSDVKEPEALETPQEGEHLVAERATSCPSGWRQICGRCFLYVPRALTWARAERNCQSMGANLASVHRAEEYHEIKRMITDVTHGHPLTWIGGSDGAEERVWLWSDGTPFRFTYWCRGEPNNRKRKQHCLISNSGDNKCWDDQQCWYTYPSVCAKRL